jgi:hypothetical protein
MTVLRMNDFADLSNGKKACGMANNTDERGTGVITLDNNIS